MHHSKSRAALCDLCYCLDYQASQSGLKQRFHRMSRRISSQECMSYHSYICKRYLNRSMLILDDLLSAYSSWLYLRRGSYLNGRFVLF
jgi:hypothetical protein